MSGLRGIAFGDESTRGDEHSEAREDRQAEGPGASDASGASQLHIFRRRRAQACGPDVNGRGPHQISPASARVLTRVARAAFMAAKPSPVSRSMDFMKGTRAPLKASRWRKRVWPPGGG